MKWKSGYLCSAKPVEDGLADDNGKFRELLSLMRNENAGN
jgi:hypothetical protein